jgi:putative aldouronate transport system substrate-binding protein
MKKVFVFGLALCMASMLFAGGRSQNQGGSGNRIQVSAPGVLPITQQKYTMTAFMVINPDSYTDLATNTVLADFEKATNVHLDLVTAMAGESREKINLLLNSGEYPEVIITSDVGSGSDRVRYGTSEGIYLPLNDLIEQNAPNITAYFAKYPWVKEDITSPDGKIYGIPAIDGGAKRVVHTAMDYKVWFNHAWLDKLGLKQPTTTEEFRTVLRAFKTQDPNGNGKADEIPMTGCTAGWAAEPYWFLLNAFGYFHSSLVSFKNGVYTPVANQDYIREGLAYIKSLWDEGLIDPAAFTQDWGQMQALGNGPEVVTGAVAYGHSLFVADLSNTARTRQYSVLEPLTGPNGYRGLPYYGDEVHPANTMFMITDKCKNPEVAIKWADAYNTLEWTIRGMYGIKGKQWDDADPGTFGMDGKTPARYKILPGGTTISNDTIGWTLRLMEEDYRVLFQVSGDIYDPANWEAYLYQQTLRIIPYAADSRPLPVLSYTESAAARMSQINTSLSGYVGNAFVEFITGRRNLDAAGWNTYKQDLERLGYSEYVKLMQDAYNNR